MKRIDLQGGMRISLLRRARLFLAVLLGVVLLNFALFHLAGTSPVYHILGRHASPEDARALTHRLGLDRPLIEQLGATLAGLATLDLGYSLNTGEAVTSLIWRGMGPSLSLALPAFMLSLALAIALALVTLRRRALGSMVFALSLALMSVSFLTIVILGQAGLAFHLGWFPLSGYDRGVIARWGYLALPVLLWALAQVGYDYRYCRAVMGVEAARPHIVASRARGLSEGRILWCHILPNAMIPLVSRAASTVPFLFLGSLILESFFAIPGLGALMVDAINGADYPVIQGVTLLGSLFYLVINTLADLAYAWLDPRVRS